MNFEFKRLNLDALDGATLDRFSKLAEPAAIPCLHGSHPDGVQDTTSLAVAAFYKQTPVGLVLASYIPILRIAEIHSLFVLEGYRNQHIGTNMLLLLEQELVKMDCILISLSYATNIIGVSALEHLLSKLGWSSPKLFHIQCHFDEKTFNPPWLECPVALPEDFKEFLWTDLTQSEKEKLIYQQEQGLFPATASPFGKKETLIDFSTSLGLKHHDEVIGWMITHRLAADRLNYAAFFIQKKYQHQGIAIHMLCNSIKRQRAEGIRWGMLEINVNEVEPSWQNFVKHKLIPHASKVNYKNQIWRHIKKPMFI